MIKKDFFTTATTLFILFQALLFASFNGVVVDKNSLKPINEAIVSDSKQSVKSDENGSFTIQSNEKIFHIKAYGYRPYEIEKDLKTTQFKIEPINVKALYLTFWGANINSKTLKKLLQIIDEKELNAIVVDVKNEYGSTSYKTGFEQANSYGAWSNRTIKNMDEFMALMKQKNIYTIARIVTFKDELQAINNPSYAVADKDGKIWRDGDGMAWVDPFDKRAHKYALSIAEDAAKVGFDEINFDYIRFPTREGLQYSKECNQENRIKAIGEFLDEAQNELRKYGVFISADTYGNICWTDDDNNIGQTVSSLAQHADYLAPMLYPSGFASGSFNFQYPSEYPYAVIYRSIKHIDNLVDPKRVRPWLQYFKDYAHKKRIYGKFEVNEQVRAAEEIKTNGWMMWSPSSSYHLSYFKKL
ncbi:MAG: putative glycoside hydrolase [Sulfurimonas sp.]|nr:putative glycoside hydrolase [Sulfurimonas sp.]